ncbi:MAG TPA: hypothetical protein VN889_04065, partial [Solirubrobacteraceae bacterium]|nr:hypothetical protein [Solirubrobacteraceae bacterium]
MRATRRRMLPLLFGAVALASLTAPAVAEAHGIVGKADLPIPVWLFSWTAAIVLVVSFVALSTLWRTPQLQREHRRRLLGGAARDAQSPAAGSELGSARARRLLAPAFETLAGAIGLALFALVIYSGFDGAQVANANFSVTFIYVIFWVGFPLASVIFGDIFRAFAPWRSFARLVRWLGRKTAPRAFAKAPLRYPERLGMWPAIAV